MAGGMISQIGGAGDTLDRLQRMVEEERNKAAGRARVARDSLNAGDFAVKEAEQKMLADQALADFNSAIKLEPKKAQLYRLRSYIHSNRKDYKRSIADMSTVIKLRTDSPLRVCAPKSLSLSLPVS